MMAQILCTFCNQNVGGPFGHTVASINLTKYKWCNHCHSNNNEEDNFYFCSVDCLVNFVKEKATDLKVGSET